MAGTGGSMRDPVTLWRRLETAPAAFDFYAAMRLIDCAHPAAPRIGQAGSPREEAARFGQHTSLAFEGAMLAGVERDGAGVPRLLVNFFGLLGASGPLPVHLTEYVRDRQRNALDPTMARFLDVFHHRMIALFYRAWATAQPSVSLDRGAHGGDEDRFGAYVASLIGLGMPTLRGRDAVPDHAKLHYAGRLAPHAKNADGLAAVLSDDLGVPVRVQEFVGHWMTLPADGLCLLGSGARAERLGVGTVIGKRVWNAQHRFRLVIGPVDMARARDLMPDGPGMVRIRDWVRNYAGLAFDWDVNLVIEKESVLRLRMGEARLGWSSWLASRAPEQDDRQLRFSPARTAATPIHSSEGAIHG